MLFGERVIPFGGHLQFADRQKTGHYADFRPVLLCGYALKEDSETMMSALTPKSRHCLAVVRCPLCAINGLMRRSKLPSFDHSVGGGEQRLGPTVLDYCALAGASGRTAATPSGLMLKARKVNGPPPGFPH